jgi:hypothetical protein
MICSSLPDRLYWQMFVVAKRGFKVTDNNKIADHVYLEDIVDGVDMVD